MRKVISFLLGLALLGGGLWGLVYMLLHSEPMKLLFWTIPIGGIGLGVAILWEDTADFIARRRNKKLGS